MGDAWVSGMSKWADSPVECEAECVSLNRALDAHGWFLYEHKVIGYFGAILPRSIQYLAAVVLVTLDVVLGLQGKTRVGGAVEVANLRWKYTCLPVYR